MLKLRQVAINGDLSTGDYSSALFTLDIASAAGNISKTRIETVKDDFSTWQGPLSSGAISDDTTPTQCVDY